MMRPGSWLRSVKAPSPISPSEPTGIRELLHSKRLIVCVGSGGVGKTTTAAALALTAAREGRQTAVLTIDPARRLRDALGIDTLDGEPQRVRLPREHRAAGGSLDAMLLDAKRTFDELIQRYAPSQTAADRVLANRIYQSISTALAGSQEYMAMERLHAIAASERYDLLIVDTPPTQHALDFLEAPQRLTALLSSRAAAILQNPTLILSRGGSRIAQAALGAILRGLERFTGLDLLRELADFAGGLEAFSDGFQSRAAEMARALRDQESVFLLVTTAESPRVTESLAFHHELVRAELPFGGFVVNRILPPSLVRERLPEPARHAGPDAGLARKLAAVQHQYTARAHAERAEIARLEAAAAGALLVTVPLLAREPTSIRALAAMADSLS